MAQKQFTTYQADILSFELREAILGIARPGRYSGYDEITADGTPNGTIYLKLGHTSAGVQKLAKLGSSLGDPIGVAVTTQGTIIHEDQDIDIDIPDNNTGGNFRWYLIYIEHDYVEVQGANNATYGYIAGSDNNVIPTLTEAYHRVILGYIRADVGATSISGLTYFPATSIRGFGDDKLNSILWGNDAVNYLNKENEVDAEVGVIPSDGIIGPRRYTEQNYVGNGESLSDSLDAIDMKIADVIQDLFTVGNKKLDDWLTPDDNTDLNATTSYHGLLPKLPATSPTSKFLRGDGSWSVPVGGRFVMRTGAFVTDFTLNDSSTDTGELDLSSIIPSDADVVILKIIVAAYNIPDGYEAKISLRGANSGGFHGEVGTGKVPGTDTGHKRLTHTVIIPCDINNKIYYSLVDKTYLVAASGGGIFISVVGWQTYTP